MYVDGETYIACKPDFSDLSEKVDYVLSDYNNQQIRISDLMYYDMETLENEYPTIKIKSPLGMVKHVSSVDGYITDLSIP